MYLPRQAFFGLLVQKNKSKRSPSAWIWLRWLVVLYHGRSLLNLLNMVNHHGKHHETTIWENIFGCFSKHQTSKSKSAFVDSSISCRYCPSPIPPEGTYFVMSSGLEMDSVPCSHRRVFVFGALFAGFFRCNVCRLIRCKRGSRGELL